MQNISFQVQRACSINMTPRKLMRTRNPHRGLHHHGFAFNNEIIIYRSRASQCKWNNEWVVIAFTLYSITMKRVHHSVRVMHCRVPKQPRITRTHSYRYIQIQPSVHHDWPGYTFSKLNDAWVYISCKSMRRQCTAHQSTPHIYDIIECSVRNITLKSVHVCYIKQTTGASDTATGAT